MKTSHIIKYQILESCNSEYLEKRVNDLIREGWQPHGGLVMASDAENAYRYIQAMIKEVKF